MTDSTLHVRILKEIRRPDLPDYGFLASDAAIAAMEALLAKLLTEAEKAFDAIESQDPATATFASVVEPVLTMDEDFDVLWGFLHHSEKTDTTAVKRRIIELIQPQAIAFRHRILKNKALHGMLATIQAKQKLTAAQKRSVHLLLTAMEMSGAGLKEKAQQRLLGMDQRMEQLSLTFMQNITEERKVFFHRITDERILGRMPQQDKDMAKAEAQSRKLTGWVFTLSPPSYSAILRHCTDRAVRKKFYLANGTVATAGKRDNRPLILEILQLRREKARLFGMRDFAAYVLKDRMAPDTDTVKTFVQDFAKACKKKANRELKQLTAATTLKTLHPWDASFAGEELKRTTLSLNEQEVKQYFPLPAVLRGAFDVSEKLFGVRFVPLKKKGFGALQVFEVHRGRAMLGYFLLDLPSRPDKRIGAWCGSLRMSSTTNGRTVLPIIVNVMSIAMEKGRTPLLQHRDVETLFHELGHALHSLLTEAPYRNLHSEACEWDFIELPSQLLENWTWERDALQLYAHHVDTGEPIPRRLLSSLRKTQTLLSGMGGLFQATLALLDLTLHTSTPPKTVRELDALCRKVMDRYEMIPVPASVKLQCAFYHVFAGGYAAGYYSYLWAEILEADAFSRFRGKNILSRAVGDHYRRTILAQGALKPGGVMIRDFLGRKPRLKALLRKKALI